MKIHGKTPSVAIGCVAMALAACSPSGRFEEARGYHPAVLGGTVDVVAAYGATVIVNGNCSGTVVGDAAHVLTASHCICTTAGVCDARATVVTDTATGQQTVSGDVTGFPGWTNAIDVGDAYGDLAMIELDTTLDGVVPVRISLDEANEGSGATVIGFGLDSWDGSYGVRRFANLAITSIADDRGTLFAEGGAPHVLGGDSGGTLVSNATGQLVGVTSFVIVGSDGVGIGSGFAALAPALAWFGSFFDAPDPSPTGGERVHVRARVDPSLAYEWGVVRDPGLRDRYSIDLACDETGSIDALASDEPGVFDCTVPIESLTHGTSEARFVLRWTSQYRDGVVHSPTNATWTQSSAAPNCVTSNGVTVTVDIDGVPASLEVVDNIEYSPYVCRYAIVR